MFKNIMLISAITLFSVFFLVGPQVQAVECQKLEKTSGYVDEDGCPISIEDYEVMSKEATRVKWERIIPIGAVIIVIPAFIIVRHNRKK